MNIQHLRIRKLYGFLDKDIEFKNNISILVGINGSGKTSVLNIINWLLKPNFNELCLIEFQSITLKFNYKEDDYILKCAQNNVEITIDIENKTKKKKYNQVQASFKRHPKHFTKNEDLKSNYIGAYDNLHPEEHERETWKFIFDELPKPIVIGLDRNLYTEEGEEVRVENENNLSKDKLRRIKKTSASPIDKVNSLLLVEHNIYRNKVLQLYSSLNEKIMLSAFDKIFTKTNIDTLLNQNRPSIQTIEILNDQVVNFLQENQILKSSKNKASEIAISIEKVNKYFNTLKDILKEANQKKEYDLLYITNISQFQKINDLILEFKEFEEQNNRLFHPLKEFLDTLNSFFIDSAKQLYFDKESSELKFNILNKSKEKIDSGRNIKNLSSGEKQLLILFTYIKYNKNLSVFIIDEPELSLHPKWQGDFLSAVQKLMPKSSQLILATHSPEVIGDKEEFCSILLPYNQ